MENIFFIGTTITVSVHASTLFIVSMLLPLFHFLADQNSTKYKSKNEDFDPQSNAYAALHAPLLLSI